MTIFILLTFKYVEVTYRFPQGGGVVTVAQERLIIGLAHWVGCLFLLITFLQQQSAASLECST
jgi:hypothetical protein